MEKTVTSFGKKSFSKSGSHVNKQLKRTPGLVTTSGTTLHLEK